MENGVGIVRVKAMTAISRDERNTVGDARYGVKRLCDLVGLAYALIGEDGAILAVDDKKTSRGDKTRKVTHVEFVCDAGNKVANAVIHRRDGMTVGANGTGGHSVGNTLIKTRRIDGGGAAARVAHEDKLFFIKAIKMRECRIDRTADIRHALTDGGAPEKECCHGGNVTVGLSVSLGTALTEVSLLDAKRGKALLDGAYGKVAVSARDHFFVTGVDGLAERDVHTRGVSLQTDHQRHGAGGIVRDAQNAGEGVAHLGGEGEAVLGVRCLFVLICEGEGIPLGLVL